MNIKKYLLTSFLACTGLLASAQALPSKSEIISVAEQVNDYWINVNPHPGNREWARAVYFTGNLDFYKVYPHPLYLDYAEGWAELHSWSLSGGDWTINADQQCAGQSYIDMYLLSGADDPEKIGHITTVMNNMVQWEQTDAWWWIDALYMAMPSFVRLGVILEDEAYFDHMYKLYTDTKVDRGLYNEEVGLWYRDESFLPPYTTPNGKDSFWSRGNGWVFGAHVRVLQQLPDTHANYEEYKNTFINMAEALKSRQRTDGFWNVSLDDPDDYGGPETSGTAFFTYGMAWGINNGFLDEEIYKPVVEKAWAAMVETAVHETGYLGFIQGVGVGPASSQPVNYWSNADFGVGAFLLASSELVKLAEGEMPSPPTFWAESLEVKGDSALVIDFNQPLDAASAGDPENYIINGLTVQTAEVNGDQVQLTFGEDLSYGKYDLEVVGVLSESGESIDWVRDLQFIYNDLSIYAFSSYENNSSNIPANTLDMDLNTRWSAEGPGQWITFDLGDYQVLDSVGMAFYSGDQRRAFFNIAVSLDGESFDEIHEGESSGETTELETFTLESTVAKYVRVTGFGNSLSAWNSITEVRGFMSELNPPTDILLSNDTIFEMEPGFIIGELQVEDADEGDVHIFELMEEEGFDHDLFEIDGNQLKLKSSVEIEGSGTYSIVVRCTDLGGNLIEKELELHAPKTTLLSVMPSGQEFLIFPVPSPDGIVKLECRDCNDSMVQVFSLNGQHIDSRFIKTGRESLDFSAYHKGTYIIKVIKDGKLIGRQLIVLKE